MYSPFALLRDSYQPIETMEIADGFATRTSNGLQARFAFLSPVPVAHCPSASRVHLLEHQMTRWPAVCRTVISNSLSDRVRPRPRPLSRRDCLTKIFLPLAVAVPVSLPAASRVESAETVAVAMDTDKALEQLREVTALQDLAFEYTNRYQFSEAEVLWTKLISLNENNAAAYSNRGNCRTSQGKFQPAVEDFDRAIVLSPDEPDPYLGKGVALEGLREFRRAIDAYETANTLSVSKYKTEDAVAINNIGNAHGALGDWQTAYDKYKQAANLDSHFVFALANEALALYQLGSDDAAALKTMRFLTLKYPRFGDMHAAIAMALWDDGDLAKAEDEWYKAVETDSRYEDVSWVSDIRRWPPRLIRILKKFRAISKSS